MRRRSGQSRLGPPDSPVEYARSIRSAENFREAVRLAGLAPSGNGVMRCIRALGARGLSSILSSPTKCCASVPEGIDGLRYERSARRFESCRTLHKLNPSFSSVLMVN